MNEMNGNFSEDVGEEWNYLKEALKTFFLNNLNCDVIFIVSYFLSVV